MSHVAAPGKSGSHPSDWDCGLHNSIMGGNGRMEWSPCNVMDFRRMYTKFSDSWCLPGKIFSNFDNLAFKCKAYEAPWPGLIYYTC